MDANTANTLRELNNRFYALQAQSFSETRNHPWPGWRRVVSKASASCGPIGTVMDVACGNMRFERFCCDEGLLAEAEFHALDSCPDLACDLEGVHFREFDVIEPLVASAGASLSFPYRDCDLAVCFGFFHHVPGFDNRVALLRAMLDSVRVGGVVACTFWRFMDNEKLASAAIDTTRNALRNIDACLERGDYLIGWQGKEGVYRYCHHFDDEEIGSLANAVSNRAHVLDRFVSDGRTNDLNEYLVLERREAVHMPLAGE